MEFVKMNKNGKTDLISALKNLFNDPTELSWTFSIWSYPEWVVEGTYELRDFEITQWYIVDIKTWDITRQSPFPVKYELLPSVVNKMIKELFPKIF